MPSVMTRPRQCGEAPREPQGDQREADRERQRRDPDRDVTATMVLPAALDLTSARPPTANIIAMAAPAKPETMCARC